MKKAILKGIKKESKKWIKKNPEKTLKDYLEKFSKKKEKIDDLSPQRIDELFTFMITEDMSQKEFREWTKDWYDDQVLIDMMEEWGTSLKRDSLREYYRDKKLPIL